MTLDTLLATSGVKFLILDKAPHEIFVNHHKIKFISKEQVTLLRQWFENCYITRMHAHNEYRIYFSDVADGINGSVIYAAVS